MFAYIAEFEAVPVVNVAMKEMGSGFSGAPTATTPQTVFPENEVVGQFYSYKVSNNEVILGTRNASIMGQRIAVGIQPLAGAKYVCIANRTDAESQTAIVLDVQGMYISCNLYTYLRHCYTY